MALKRPRERIKRERHVPLSFFARWRGAVRWDGDIGYVDSLVNPPPIFFSSCRKENGPWTVQKKRRWAQTCTCVQVRLKRGSSEYVPTGIGNLLPARAILRHLKYISPRVWFGGDFVGGSGHPLFLFPLALPWCLRGGKFSGNLKMTCGAGLLGRNFLIESGQKEGTIDAEISKH